MDRFDVDRLDDDWPFEIDRQASHLFKHSYLGLDDVSDVWTSDPLFYPAKPPAHWLMVAEVSGQVLTVPLAPSSTGDPSRCRPIGCYIAADHLARRFVIVESNDNVRRVELHDLRVNIELAGDLVREIIDAAAAVAPELVIAALQRPEVGQTS